MSYRPRHPLVLLELRAIECIPERHCSVSEPTRITRAILGFGVDESPATPSKAPDPPSSA